MIIPETNFCCICMTGILHVMTLVIHSFCFHSFVLFSCFVVLIYSRKIRLHTQHTDFSICFGSKRQTADTYSHGWSRHNRNMKNEGNTDTSTMLVKQTQALCRLCDCSWGVNTKCLMNVNSNYAKRKIYRDIIL